MIIYRVITRDDAQQRHMPGAPGMAIFALATAPILPGCHTMRFTVDTGEAVNVVEERKSFWFWGLAPTQTVDVSRHCPQGAMAIKEETTFVDGLFSLIALGIWSPRSSWYYCGTPHEG